MASAETSRNSFSVAPLAACTARPFSTVAVYRASVAQSVPAGRSSSFDGTEAVIVGDLSEISDGVPVRVEPGH